MTDDQFNAIMHDVRKIVYSLAVIIGLLIAILGLYAAHLDGALPSGSPTTLLLSLREPHIPACHNARCFSPSSGTIATTSSRTRAARL